MMPTEFSEWVERLPDDQRARMRDHLKRQRRAQAAVKPHAEHREAERRLREAATAEADPDRRRDLLSQADRHAARSGELVRMVERIANESG